MIRDEGAFACALRALEQRDYSAAETAFSALLDAADLGADDRAFLFNKRGVARIGLRRPEAARSDFDSALRLRPTFAPAIANLGNLLLETGELDAAIARYERAIACDPEYAVAHLNLGVAYKRAGRIAEGVRALRHAQRLEQRAIAASSWRARRR